MARGASLANDPIIVAPRTGLLVLETFPFSAWRSLGIVALPSKRKHKARDIADRAERLKQSYNLSFVSEPTHDELQALVASLAGLAVLRCDSRGYQVHGRPPILKRGVRVEGYIVDPRIVIA